MWKSLWVVSLIAAVSCRSADAGKSEVAEGTTGVRAAQLKVDLESQLVSWEPKDDDTVELTLLVSGYLPKYRKAGAEPSADGRVTLKLGEVLTFPDHHLRQAFTVRSVSETALEFDYSFKFDGKTDTGHFVLTRGLMESGFQDEWRKCSTTAQCVVIPSYCGRFAVVMGGAPEVLARNFYKKIGGRKECAAKTMEPPVAACVEGKCQPAPKSP